MVMSGVVVTFCVVGVSAEVMFDDARLDPGWTDGRDGWNPGWIDQDGS